MDYPTLEDAIDKFVDGFHYNRRSGKTYRSGLKLMVEILDGQVKTTDQLALTVLVDVYNWMAERDYSRHTVYTYVAFIRSFLKWLDLHEWLPPDYSVTRAQIRLEMVRKKNPLGPYNHKTIDDDLPLVVSYYDDLPLPGGDSFQQRQSRLVLLRNRAIVHTLYATGGRASEILQLSRRDILDGRVDEAFIIGKGGYDRALLFTPEAMAAIRAYCAERDDKNDSVFISHGRGQGKPLGRGAVWTIVKNAAEALDLHKSTSPHSFRHFRATQLLNEGMPLESVQAYLGHQDIATTRKIYAHTRTAVLKDQLKTFGRSHTEAIEDAERQRA